MLTKYNFSTLLVRRWSLNIFWKVSLMEKVWLNFGEWFMVFRDTDYKFYFIIFTWLTICVQTERCCVGFFFFSYVFSLFHLIKSLFKEGSFGV